MVWASREFRETRGTQSVRAELVEAWVGITDLRPADAAVDLRSPSARQAQGERGFGS